MLTNVRAENKSRSLWGGKTFFVINLLEEIWNAKGSNGQNALHNSKCQTFFVHDKEQK